MRNSGGVGIESEKNERGSGGHGENTLERMDIEPVATGTGSQDGQIDDRPGAPNKNRIKTGSGRADERADTAEMD